MSQNCQSWLHSVRFGYHGKSSEGMCLITEIARIWPKIYQYSNGYIILRTATFLANTLVVHFKYVIFVRVGMPDFREGQVEN